MSALADAFLSELDDDALDALAQLLAARIATIITERRMDQSSGWLDTGAAAAHLACSRDRIHDLVGRGRLHPRRDGRRLLFRRDDLDAYLEAAA